MNIMLLLCYYKPEKTAGAHLAEDRNNALVQAGHKIRIYAPTPTRGVSDEVRAAYKKKKIETEQNGAIEVRRFALYREGRNPLGRALRYALLELEHLWFGLTAPKPDLMPVGSTPPINGFVAAALTKIRKIPYVYILEDIVPDSMVNAGMTAEGSLIWKIGRKIEDFTYRHAAKIVVISDDFKKNIMAKGVPEEKIEVIPLWVNTDNVYNVPRQENVLFERYKLDRSKYYICYSGNIGHSQNLRLLLDTATALREELPDLRFVLIGEGAARDELERTIANEKLDNVILLPFQPYEDIAHVFSLGDAGLVISKGGIGESSIPSKTWSIMAAERPVLASFDEGSALTELIERAGCGIAAAADEIEPLKDAVRKLYNDRESAREMGLRGRRYLKENLDKDVCVGRFVRLYEEIAAKNGGK